MEEEVLRDMTNKTISSLDRKFKENFGAIFSNQVKKMKTKQLTKKGKNLQIKLK